MVAFVTISSLIVRLDMSVYYYYYYHTQNIKIFSVLHSSLQAEVFVNQIFLGGGGTKDLLVSKYSKVLPKSHGPSGRR